MSQTVKKDVLWLDIAIDDVLRVQVLKEQNQLCSVEASARLIKATVQLQVCIQLWKNGSTNYQKGVDSSSYFATHNVFHNQIQILFVLEATTEGNLLDTL